jgi:anti-anti-sigma factor
MSTPALTIVANQAQLGGPKVVTLDGNLTLETVAGFNRDLREDGTAALVLDCSKLTWLDSAGVGALVRLLVRRAKTGQSLALSGLSARNRAVLEVAQVLGLFAVFPSAEEATKAFAANRKFS